MTEPRTRDQQISELDLEKSALYYSGFHDGVCAVLDLLTYDRSTNMLRVSVDTLEGDAKTASILEEYRKQKG